jgi:hypothetical protein
MLQLLRICFQHLQQRQQHLTASSDTSLLRVPGNDNSSK